MEKRLCGRSAPASAPGDPRPQFAASWVPHLFRRKWTLCRVQSHWQRDYWAGITEQESATLNWAEPSPIAYDGPPRTLCWADHSLWVGDPTNATRIELTDRGHLSGCEKLSPCRKMDGSTKYHCGIVTDGLGRVYFSNEWYKGRFTAGKTAR